MAVGIRMKLPGITQEQFDKAHDRINPDRMPPKGLLFHASGPIDGGWGVIDFWETREDFDAFAAKIGVFDSAVHRCESLENVASMTAESRIRIVPATPIFGARNEGFQTGLLELCCEVRRSGSPRGYCALIYRNVDIWL